MIRRDLEPVLRGASKEYPVVTVIGPRQSGKTTLVRSVFDSYNYCNLENPEIRALAQQDPRSLFRQYAPPVIFDEVQRVPELLSWIQVFSDESGQNGEYILTGSHQLSLHEAISQSLAGRTSVLRLLPLSIHEIVHANEQHLAKEDLMIRGFLPRVYDRNQVPADAYRNYFQTYVERDIRQLINLRNLTQFEHFIKLLAGRVGQLLNVSSMANETGISTTTLREWISILEASFIIYRLPPYYNNFGKRFTKKPKIYFVEPGLVTWLLGIETAEQAMRDPLHGGIFENIVVIEALKTQLNAGRDPSLYFFRDSKGHEVDLIHERQRLLTPIEIKSSMTWNPDYAKNIHWLQRKLPDVTQPGHIIYAGTLFPQTDTYSAVNFLNTSTLFTNH